MFPGADRGSKVHRTSIRRSVAGHLMLGQGTTRCVARSRSRRPAEPGRRLDGRPQIASEAVGEGRAERVRDDDTFDHVCDDRTAGPPVQPDRDDRTIGSPPDRSVDADEPRRKPRRTPEARADESTSARLAGDGAGGFGEFDGGRGLHTPTIMTKGCCRVVRRRARPCSTGTAGVRHPSSTAGVHRGSLRGRTGARRREPP